MTAIGDLTHQHRHLQRRGQMKALADRRVKRLRQIPFFLVIQLFVFAVGDQPVGLSRQVDAGKRAQAEHPRVAFQRVDPHPVAHFIKIHVVGHRQRLVEIDPAQRLAGRIGFRNQPVLARVEDQFIRRHFFQFERRCSRHDLKGRPRRIFAGNRPVIHRMKRIFIDGFPVLRRDSADKLVRVKRRPAGHRQHFAIFRVEHHHGAGLGIAAAGPLQELKLLVQRFLRHLLQPVIDRQHQIVAGNRFFFRQNLHHSARDIDLDLAAAVRALDKAVVFPFQPGLADQVAGAVAIGRHGRQFRLGNFTHIAENVHTHLVMDITANRQDFHHHAGQLGSPLFNRRHDILSDVDLQPHRFEPGLALGQLLRDFARIHAQDRGGLGYHFRRRRRVSRHNGYDKAGTAGNHHHTVPVEKVSPWRNHIHLTGAVAFRQPLIFRPFHHLQIGQAAAQRQKYYNQNHG